MIPLTNKENKSYLKQKVVIYAKKNSMLMTIMMAMMMIMIIMMIMTTMMMINYDKKYHTVRDHCHYAGK